MICISDKINIGMLWVEKNVINDKPEYQRESAVWSDEKKELFLDSLINKYDIPKLYFHDLRSKKSTHKYAIVDGKQRLHTIWDFMSGKLRIADDFTLTRDDVVDEIKPGSTFLDLSENWRERFRGINLDVVLIQDAVEEDIEELFSRLNNGEPLNAAEKRNAMGGDMCKLIREISKHNFFEKTLTLKNTRYQHYEIAAKLLNIENHEMMGGDMFCDLKKRFLDKLVKDNKKLPKAKMDGLNKRVENGLLLMNRVFSKKDKLLSKQAYPPLYYIFNKFITNQYAHEKLYEKIHVFLSDFQVRRMQNLEKSEDTRDGVLIEFGRLIQQGTNDMGSIKNRVDILTRYFILDNPDLKLKDKKRAYNEVERIAIWIKGGKQCEECGKPIDLSEMEADHQIQWAHGGETTLENARSLCFSCNKILAKKIQ